MGIITLKIDNNLERMLRRKAAQPEGAVRGSLSRSVEQAIRMWLRSSEPARRERRIYVALKDDERIARAFSLNELSSKLKKLGLDPRDVVIEAIPPERPQRRMGFRTSQIFR